MTAKLIYFTTRSLDGCIEDAQGKIDWTSPDEERQQFVNDALRPVGTHLYGRRMYETMQVWTHFGSSESDPHGRAISPGCGEQPTRSSTDCLDRRRIDERMGELPTAFGLRDGFLAQSGLECEGG